MQLRVSLSQRPEPQVKAKSEKLRAKTAAPKGCRFLRRRSAAGKNIAIVSKQLAMFEVPAYINSNSETKLLLSKNLRWNVEQCPPMGVRMHRESNRELTHQAQP